MAHRITRSDALAPISFTGSKTVRFTEKRERKILVHLAEPFSLR
jgi:hypothetical protein